MSHPKAIINTSPLLALFKSNQANLLPQLFAEILIPRGVLAEINAKPDDPVTSKIQAITWLQIAENIPISELIIAWDLGRGESEVLSLAQQKMGYTAILDDRAARRCATVMRIPTMGTGAILILAKQVGLIASIKPSLDALQKAGLYLSERLIQQLLRKAGELP